jgi:hypothetical protein
LANTYFIVFSQSRYFVYGIQFFYRSMNQGQTWLFHLIWLMELRKVMLLWNHCHNKRKIWFCCTH